MTTDALRTDAARIVVERMTEAAAALLDALDSAQREAACFSFPDNEERRRWYYTPTDHGGLPLLQMTPVQQQCTHRLVASGLSMPGYVTASTIMGLENALDAAEGWRARFARDSAGAPHARDPLLYYVSIFGEPGGSSPWGWRFGGHHISLHYTVAGGRVISPTPTFFGANPAEALFVGPGRLRPLAGEEDLARELLHALDDAQRSVAVLTSVAPWDLVSGNRRSAFEASMPPGNWEIFRERLDGEALARSRENHERSLRRQGIGESEIEAVRLAPDPRGLPGSRMSPAQQQILGALIDQYLRRMPDEIAEAEAARLGGPALQRVHFAWAGGSEPRQPHYYRLQGPRLLVEYDNTQNNANHIHSVWRDPEGDFGGDLLAQHLAEAH